MPDEPTDSNWIAESAAGQLRRLRDRRFVKGDKPLFRDAAMMLLHECQIECVPPPRELVDLFAELEKDKRNPLPSREQLKRAGLQFLADDEGPILEYQIRLEARRHGVRPYRLAKFYLAATFEAQSTGRPSVASVAKYASIERKTVSEWRATSEYRALIRDVRERPKRHAKALADARRARRQKSVAAP